MEVDMGRFTFAFALILATAPAFAHDSKGPNGGRITDLGRFHAELTTKGNTVELHVTNSSKSSGHGRVQGLAVIVVGGKSERIDLAPVRGNKLAGTATVAIPPNAKGVVRLNAPNGNTSQAEFD
jgi:hypothetical protein